MSYERRKVRVGRVIGDKMDKTCIVEVEWRSFHRRYKKSIRRRSRFKAHDENSSARLGDTVTIVESRPMSKTKRWRLVDVVERQEIAELPPSDITPADEVETPMPVPVIEEAVSQEEETPVLEEAVDESQDQPDTVDEDDGEIADSEETEGDVAESPDDDAAPADEASEPEDEVEEAPENADEEDASSQEEEAPEPENEVEEVLESPDDEEAPAVDESAEPEDEPEATVESVDEETVNEEDVPVQVEDEPKEEPAEMPGSAADDNSATGESEPVDEKADEEKPRQ